MGMGLALPSWATTQGTVSSRPKLTPNTNTHSMTLATHVTSLYLGVLLYQWGRHSSIRPAMLYQELMTGSTCWLSWT